MIIRKKTHRAVVDGYEKKIAALELELAEARAEVGTLWAATATTVANADARAVAADTALARYIEDYAPRVMEGALP